MRKIKYKLEIGFCGCDDEGVMEVTEAEFQRMDQIIEDMSLEWSSSWEGDTRLYEEEWDSMSDGYEEYYANCSGSWEEISDEEYEEWQSL